MKNNRLKKEIELLEDIKKNGMISRGERKNNQLFEEWDRYNKTR